MKKIITFLVFAFAAGLGGQAQAQQAYCGTPAYKSEWLERYQQNPQVVNRSMMDTLYVPMTIHIVGTNNGTGYYPVKSLLDAFCNLNEYFEQAAIQFYIKGNIRYINRSSYYEHNYTSGGQMMASNNVPNTINCYIVSDPAGACGYYSPSHDALALSKGCLGSTDPTWAHEAGHYLDLPHTFYGWEDTEYDYNSPTPNTVSWGFIDRAVEKVNGSNCSYAGDGFCDTSPDYLNGRWNCNASDRSPQIQKDPDGVEFRSDGTLIMSYSDNACAGVFTDEQIAAMRANLEQQRPGHLANQAPPAALASLQLDPVFPAEGEAVQNNQAFELQWQPIPGAQMYYVEISRLPTFPFTVANYLTMENSVTVAADDLLPDKPYYWRIRPFNRYDACSGYSNVHTFELAELTSASAQETLKGLRLFPNPAKENQEVILDFVSEQAGMATASLLSLTGQALHSRRLDIAPGANRISLSTAGLPKGLYVVRIDANGGANYRRLMVQ